MPKAKCFESPRQGVVIKAPNATATPAGTARAGRQKASCHGFLGFFILHVVIKGPKATARPPSRKAPNATATLVAEPQAQRAQDDKKQAGWVS